MRAAKAAVRTTQVTIFIGLLLSISCGCERSSARPTGRLIFTVPGSEVGMVDLTTRAHSRLAWLWPTSHWNGGIGGVVQGRAILSVSGMNDAVGIVYVVPLAGGRLMPILNADIPVATTDGRWIVCRPDGDEAAARMLRIATSPDSNRIRVDTLSPRLAVSRDYDQWSPPVALDSAWVAFRGRDGAVWKCDAGSGRVERLGGDGLIPMFRVAGTKLLICGRSSSRTIVAFDLESARAAPVGDLRGMVGYAPHPQEPLTLVVVPGRPRIGRDSYRLELRDWRNGSRHVVDEDFYFSGNAVWLAD